MQILLRTSQVSYILFNSNLGWPWNAVATNFCIEGIIQKNILNLYIVVKYARTNSGV